MAQVFDANVILRDDLLELRPLAEAGREGLYQAASDPRTWEQHPARHRAQREVFEPYFDFLLNAGGTLVACRRDDGEILGCSRFYPVVDQPDQWGIGFTFLGCAYWGGAWNRRMKALMVGHALASRSAVWLHIAPDNIRSQIASERVGAVWQYDADLDLGTGPAPYKCYTITAESWEKATGTPI